MKVTIVIEDLAETTNVKMEFDPPASNDTPHTGATVLALCAMDAITNRIAQEKANTCGLCGYCLDECGCVGTLSPQEVAS